MAALGFLRRDFQIFSIHGFDARIGKIDELLHPRLIRLGDEIARELSRMMRMEVYPHVARHGRRTAEPPMETWVAIGPSPKGYKRRGFLALCVSGAGIHARAMVKAQAEKRRETARMIEAKAAALEKSLRGTRIQNYAGWDFCKMPPQVAADREFFEGLARELEKRTGAMDVGFGWPVSEAIFLERAELLDAMRELVPLYRMGGLR